MNIAVIPARGGSKRIPGKNIKFFCGKPIIAYSIEAAIESKCFDRVVVTTDDEEIADVAKSYGADVPFERPSNLSNDHIGIVPVVRHSIEWFQAHGQLPSLVCCILATAPFITTNSLLAGLEIITSRDCEYTFSVTSYPFPIQRAIRINKNRQAEMLQPELYQARSQDLEEAFHDAGQFYWGQSSAWLAEKPILNSDSVPVLLSRHLVQDIDTLEDWVSAERMYKSLEKGKR